MSTPLLTLRNAQAQQGHFSLGTFNLSIAPAERIALLGQSGAGKSSLLGLIAGDVANFAGDIILKNRPLQQWSIAELSQHRALLPQSYEMAFSLPVREVIALGRVAHRIDPHQTSIVNDAASLASIDHLLTQSFSRLSGGEKARVHLARVFAQLWQSKCGLLLLDEPTAMLDIGLQYRLMQSTMDFAMQRQHAVISIVHDINLALRDFNRYWLMESGRIIADMPINHPHLIEALSSLYGIRLSVMGQRMGRPFVMPVDD